MQADFGRPDPPKSEPIRCGATSTSNGLINLDQDDFDEEWLTYEKLTERAFRRIDERSLDPGTPVSGDENKDSKRSTKSKKQVDRNQQAVIILDDRADGDKSRDFASLSMRKSLFPHVPPYVLFHSHDRGYPKELPKDFSQLLRWKFTTSMPRILIKILINSGYQMVLKDNDWSAIWNPSSNDTSKFKRAKRFQKLNTMPGSQNLGNKVLLWTHLRTMRRKFGSKEYSIMPKTFILPREVQKLENMWQRYDVGSTWIIKPPYAGRGQGIKVINQWWEIPKWHSVIVQRYISRPKLINGSKFDLRVYVLLTSVNPTRIYIYKEGLVRFASVRYIRSATNLKDRYMHLTNTSVNKQNPAYVTNDGANSFRAHKWSFESLWLYLKEEGVDVDELWSKIKDIVVKTIVATESSISAAILENLVSNYTCYELYGFDVLLDEDLQPWLLEANTLPSLQTDSHLDTAIKGALVKNVLNMAGYQIPKTGQIPGGKIHSRKYDSIGHDYRLHSMALSLREKRKQNEFTSIHSREEYLERILENLTRDDLRHLVLYEDELAQVENFEKIFPTSSSYLYFKYFEVQRYYDRLLDAWEHLYSDNRGEGIGRLRKCCEKMQHLDLNLDYL